MAFRFLWIALGIILGLSAGTIVLRSLDKGESDMLPVYGTVPDFTLVERSGEPVSLNDLRGKLWVADFFFTSCTGPCPMMSSRMSALQAAFAGDQDVVLVSFSIDPAHDTPEVLRKYAEQYGAQPGKWLFLTGDRETILRLADKGFRLNGSASHESGSGFVHSTRFNLVDAEGNVRGYFASEHPEYRDQILEAVKKLRKEMETNGRL